MAKSIPESKWVWYGYAGHLAVGARCAFHMSTRIGNYLISTVGHYIPKGKETTQIESIGSGNSDYFETMIFPCSGEDKYGNPIIELNELYCRRYSNSREAEANHRKVCKEYAKK